jgi:hypothetical protein
MKRVEKEDDQKARAAVRRLIWDAHITAAMYALWRDDMREIEYIEHFGEEPTWNE